MTRTQRFTLYGIILFMMIWGIDLINSVRDGKPITAKDIFNIFYFSQAIYAGCTFLLMHCAGRKFFHTKKYLQFILAMIGVVFAFVLFRYIIEEVIFPVLFNIRNYWEGYSAARYILDNIYYSLVCISFGFLAFMLDTQVGNQKKQAELLQRNKEAELQFLRSQVNPHFLFNTLNNIYSLVYDQSPKAPGAMLQLSELMRYILYEKKELVPISKEWTYIENFITLQKLRFDHDLVVELIVEGDTNTHLIPPYLLIPFIENAFKHGDFRNSPLKLRLIVTSGSMEFETSNRISTRNKDEAGGIGMDNVRRRLELLYPGKYQLTYSAENGSYYARLLLNF